VSEYAGAGKAYKLGYAEQNELANFLANNMTGGTPSRRQRARHRPIARCVAEAEGSSIAKGASPMTIPNAEERAATSQLRRWCPDGKTHQRADDPVCGWEHGDKTGHRLRLRRMLLCSACEQGYFTQEAFDGHECHSAY
jgi:hypothetical protein